MKSRHRAGRFVDVGNDSFCVLMKHHPRIGEMNRACGAAQELGGEVFFELGHPSTHRGFRHSKLFCRGGEALCPDNLRKNGDVIQVHLSHE